MPRLVDHASARPGAQAVKDAGFDGAVRYLANSPDRGMPNKILTPDEARGYIERGMFLVSNWQKGKGPTADWRRGKAGGVADATEAARVHKECGGPDDAPIFFSVDEDVNLATWNKLCLPYFQGVNEVLGVQRTGIYGGQRTLWWAEEDKVVGSAGDRLYMWQTRAWSCYNPDTGGWDGQLRWSNKAVLRQERIDQDRIGTTGIDINTTWGDEFGQWKFKSAPVAASEESYFKFLLAQMMGPK